MGGRLKAALILLVMFGLGLVTGRAWERYDALRTPAFQPAKSPRLQHFYRELGLTPDQEKQMDVIFVKAHERATQINEEVAWDLKEVHNDSLNAIQDILTPEQRTKFDVIRHRLHSARGGHKRVLEKPVSSTAP